MTRSRIAMLSIVTSMLGLVACSSTDSMSRAATTTGTGGTTSQSVGSTSQSSSDATSSSTGTGGGGGGATQALDCTDVTFPSGPNLLHGYLSRPAGKGSYSTIVYNHGSEQQPGCKHDITSYFVFHGYGVFAPIRRGQGASQGPYLMDQVNALPPAQRQQAMLDGLVDQVSDVLAGFTYLKSVSWVDPKHLYVAGCSLGGIETMLANEHAELGLAGAIDFGGGAESANNSQLIARLVQSVDAATSPFLLIQAENDWSLLPTQALSAEAQAKGKSYKAMILPPNGTTHHQGHTDFCRQATNAWGPVVLAFINP